MKTCWLDYSIAFFSSLAAYVPHTGGQFESNENILFHQFDKNL